MGMVTHTANCRKKRAAVPCNKELNIFCYRVFIYELMQIYSMVPSEDTSSCFEENVLHTLYNLENCESKVCHPRCVLKD